MSAILQSKFGKKIYPQGKTIDVVSNMNWLQKRSLTDEELNQVPRIELTEYQMSKNGLYSTLKFYITALANSNLKKEINPYENLYSAKPTGMKFIFPYFNEELDNHSSAWQVAKDLADASGLDLGGIVKKITNIGKTAYEAYRATIRPDKVSSYKVSPYIWKSTVGIRPSINFSLFNTPTSPEENITDTYTNNKNLVDYLRLASTFDQVGPIEAQPPSIFTVLIPGVYYMPAATIESFQVKSIGSVILKNIRGHTQFLPEAFNINMILQPLVPSSQGITFAGAHSTMYDVDLKDFSAISNTVDEKLEEVANNILNNQTQKAFENSTDEGARPK